MSEATDERDRRPSKEGDPLRRATSFEEGHLRGWPSSKEVALFERKGCHRLFLGPGPALARRRDPFRPSSRIRWVISRSQTLHHFQWRFPTTSSRCFVASRMLRNQILLSPSPTFSSLTHRAKWSRFDVRAGSRAFAIGIGEGPVENVPDGLDAGLREFSRAFQPANPCDLLDQHDGFPNPSDFAISIIRDNLTETSVGRKTKIGQSVGSVLIGSWTSGRL